MYFHIAMDFGQEIWIGLNDRPPNTKYIWLDDPKTVSILYVSYILTVYILFVTYILKVSAFAR